MSNTRQPWILFAAFAGLGLLLAATLFVERPTNQLVTINNTTVPPAPTLDPARVAQGAALYAQYCADCHGADLKGATNWKQRLSDGSLPPPPHDSFGHTWHHPDELLVTITLDGGDPAVGSKMPAFRGRLSAADVEAILDFFKSRWGQEERDYQWWLTATSGGQP